MSKDYKQINKLFWLAVEVEDENPILAKKLLEDMEDLEMRHKKR